jgi:protein SCO1/2
MKTQTMALVVVAIIAGVAVVLVGAQVFARPYSFQGSLIEPALDVGDFQLQDQHGETYRLSDRRGQVVLLFFGYTSCPDVCPTTLGEYKRLREALGEQAAGVDFVFVTVDPERDTAERLGDHLARFDPAFIGLSGSQEALEGVWEKFFVFREIEVHNPGESYLVDHTSRIYAVDHAGGLRLTFPFGMDTEQMAADIRYLVEES